MFLKFQCSLLLTSYGILRVYFELIHNSEQIILDSIDKNILQTNKFQVKFSKIASLVHSFLPNNLHPYQYCYGFVVTQHNFTHAFNVILSVNLWNTDL